MRRWKSADDISQSGSKSEFDFFRKSREGVKGRFYQVRKWDSLMPDFPGIVLLDLSCLVSIGYNTKNIKIQYSSRILIHLRKLLPPDVECCLFDIPPDRGYQWDEKDRALIAGHLEKDQVRLFTADTLPAVLLSVRKLYSASANNALVITSFPRQYENFRKHLHMLLVDHRPGCHEEKDVSEVLQSINGQDGHTICLDIDDTTIFFGQSCYAGKTCINTALIDLIDRLHGSMSIREILFLTARSNLTVQECINPTLDSVSLQDLEKKNPTDVVVVAYHLNSLLKQRGINSLVRRVLYSRAKNMSHLGSISKADIMLTLILKANHKPILIDNSEEEHQAWNSYRQSTEKAGLLPSIRIKEQSDLSQENIERIVSFFSNQRTFDQDRLDPVIHISPQLGL